MFVGDALKKLFGIGDRLTLGRPIAQNRSGKVVRYDAPLSKFQKGKVAELGEECFLSQSRQSLAQQTCQAF